MICVGIYRLRFKSVTVQWIGFWVMHSLLRTILSLLSRKVIVAILTCVRIMRLGRFFIVTASSRRQNTRT